MPQKHRRLRGRSDEDNSLLLWGSPATRRKVASRPRYTGSDYYAPHRVLLAPSTVFDCSIPSPWLAQISQPFLWGDVHRTNDGRFNVSGGKESRQMVITQDRRTIR